MWSGSGPVLDIAGISLGLREGVIALIALVALYMLLVLLRMRRLRRQNAAQAAPVVVEPSFIPPPSAPTEDVAARQPEMPEAAAAAAAGWAGPSPADALPRPGLDAEVAQLRDEVDALRGELAALRADMLHDLAHMRAAQTVSPIYGDAMQMAVSGYEPAVIAERCGIARAEAELVVALAKSQNS